MKLMKEEEEKKKAEDEAEKGTLGGTYQQYFSQSTWSKYLGSYLSLSLFNVL